MQEKESNVYQPVTPDTIAEEERRIRESRREAVKEAVGCTWICGTIAGGAGMCFSEDPTIKGAGTAIFIANILAPGVLMAKETVEDIVGKWQGKDAGEQ